MTPPVDLDALRRVARIAAGTDRAVLIGAAADEIERLRAEVARLSNPDGMRECPGCYGYGHLHGYPCKFCNASGYLP